MRINILLLISTASLSLLIGSAQAETTTVTSPYGDMADGNHDAFVPAFDLDHGTLTAIQVNVFGTIDLALYGNPLDSTPLDLKVDLTAGGEFSPGVDFDTKAGTGFGSGTYAGLAVDHVNFGLGADVPLTADTINLFTTGTDPSHPGMTRFTLAFGASYTDLTTNQVIAGWQDVGYTASGTASVTYTFDPPADPADPAPVPEPSTIALLSGAVVAGMAGRRRRVSPGKPRKL